MRRFLWILLVFGPCYPQQAVLLQQLLDDIAKKEGVRFSYIAEELAVYRLSPPDEALSLQAKLDYIHKNTRLRIEQVTQNYFTVYNDKRMDKPLCGYLIDSSTGLPVENAAITIRELGIATASDGNGYFELAVLKPNTISINHMGYQPRQLSPHELYVSDCPKISMVVQVQELPEAATQRFIASGISLTAFGTITVKPQKFGTLPGLTEPDVLQTMQQLPGITSVDETISNINVRGGTHDQNLFLWNGIRMFQTGHFFGLLSAFNPMLSTQITISKNGTSAFFGEGVSATVNMSSHTRIEEQCYHAASVDLVNANFYSKVKLSEKATILAAGRRTYTDLLKTPTFRAYEDRIFQNNVVTDLSGGQTVPITSDQDFYFYDYAAQYHQIIGKHEMIIDGIGLENKVDFNQKTDAATKTSFLSQRNFGASLTWKSRWNEKHRSELQPYFSWYELRSRNEVSQQIDQQNRVFNKGLRTKHSYALSQQVSIDAGYQFDEVSIRNVDEAEVPPFFRQSTQVSRSHALVAESRWAAAGGKLNVSLGLRSNYFEKYGRFIVEPRLAADYLLFPGFRVNLLAETKNQTLCQITELQQDFLGIEKRRWTLANGREIPVQQSRQIAVGFHYRRGGWLVSVDNFYKKVSGITSKSQSFNNQLEFMGISGNYTVLGAEVLLQKSFERFYSWVSYTYNDNRYDFAYFSPAAFANNFSIPHSVGWAAIYEWHRVQMAVGAKWHTGTPYTPPSGYFIDQDNPTQSRVQYNAPNSHRLPDFFQVNCSASHKWNLGKATTLKASVSLWNILDTRNKVNQNYRINTAGNLPERITTYALKFTPNAAVKIIF